MSILSYSSCCCAAIVASFFGANTIAKNPAKVPTISTAAIIQIPARWAVDVKELKVEVLKQGSGETLASDSSIKANYFGWTSDGKIFDSTNKEGSAVTPIEFSLGGVIEGWTKGLTGQKVGSTVKLTIPAEQAYGSTDTGSGQPTGPLVFIVEIKELVKSDDK